MAINRGTAATAALTILLATGVAPAEESAAELAKKLANPVAALISVPLPFNTDMNIGPGDAGERTTLNVQPVIPFAINEDWNLISRNIAPIIAVDRIFPGSGSEVGLGDTTPTVFFSPVAPTSGARDPRP